MERLTSYKSETSREMICRYEDCDVCEEYCPHMQEDNCSCLQEVLEKLGQYEDAEEQGLLLRLPCKVGDTVYTLDYIYECDCDYECVEFDAYKCEEDVPCEHQYKEYRVKETKFQIQMLAVLGKTVFLTKEEASQKLAEMKEVQNETK